MAEHRVNLITLLNVASSHPRTLKRPYDPETDWHSIAKKARLVEQDRIASKPVSDNAVGLSNTDLSIPTANDSDEESDETLDSYKYHFAADNDLLTTSALAAVNAAAWISEKKFIEGFGKISECTLEVPNYSKHNNLEAKINPRLYAKFAKHIGRQSESENTAVFRQNLLDILTSYMDLLYSRILIAERQTIVPVIALHAISHILKTRTRVLKNIEHLSKASAEDQLDDGIEIRDQGFTRPKVLVLLPFRNSAISWLDWLTTLSLAETVENRARFDSEFSLPKGSKDKLLEPDAISKYPADHIATFAGNIDDSFRVGLKVNRKTIRCFTEFYTSDIILASPLGLRMSIEKEGGDADFLSSIEIAIVDQADVMTMQNWEHVQFVFKHFNNIPKEAHGADFARIKPWYLDGKAINLRQTIILSSYETPEIRNLFYKSCKNVSGRVSTINTYPGVFNNIKRGVRQVFAKFEAPSAREEDDARFEHFKTKTIPSLLKSAVATSAHTMIFVPSYFDFLRVQAHLKSIEDLEFGCISEYSSNSEIAKSRNAFLAGKLPILVMTERFHFFRRYRIRGARTLVFYALPEHAIFYEELMSLPFEQIANNKYDYPDESEVTSQVLFSRYDLLKLERVIGKAAAKRLLKDGDNESRFVFS